MGEALAADQMVRRMVEADRGLGLSAAIARAARRCRLAPRRIRAFWNNELRDWWASEDRAIRDAYRAWAAEHCRELDASQDRLRSHLVALEVTHEGVVAQVRGVARTPGDREGLAARRPGQRVA
ncbi:hypothetical protein ACI2KH_06210 [Roseomonas mucosa]|uniref:hypothetical protein n=1 Tax=Roseomonas mucosa TaxID=207340 RepID=UPI003850357E